jgi:L-2-hydroxyglutarate oxidase LhgO
LLSPSTGIIDSHALMLAYQAEAEAAGAIVVLRTPVLGGTARNDGLELAVGGDDPIRIRCRFLVNAAGLGAPALSRMIEGIPQKTIPPAYFCRGSCENACFDDLPMPLQNKSLARDGVSRTRFKSYVGVYRALSRCPRRGSGARPC